MLRRRRAWVSVAACLCCRPDRQPCPLPRVHLPSVPRFACLYTSHVSNLIFYSLLKSWRGKPDVMIHEDELMG